MLLWVFRQRIYQSLFRILPKLLDRFEQLPRLSYLTIPAVCMPTTGAFYSQFNIVVIPFFYGVMAYLTQPKSAKSQRTIALSPSIILVLKEHHEKQKLIALTMLSPTSIMKLPMKLLISIMLSKRYYVNYTAALYFADFASF
jgi:hypothetical protein